MSSTTYSEAIILIASVIAASIFAGVVLSSMGAIGSAYSSMSSNERNAMVTKIKIIYADNVDSGTVYVYVKNVGKIALTELNKMDVYFGEYAAADYVPFNSSTPPTWSYELLGGGGAWRVGGTLRITIDYGAALRSGTYLVKVVTPSGVSDEYVFSI